MVKWGTLAPRLSSSSRFDNLVRDQAFLWRTRHDEKRTIDRHFTLMEYAEYREDMKELIAGDPLLDHRGQEEIEGIPAQHYERDNLFLIFSLNRKAPSVAQYKAKEQREVSGDDAVPRSVFNLVPYPGENGREYISRFLYAELHPVRILMRDKGLNLMGFADAMGIARAKIPKSFFTDSIMKHWNLAKMKKNWPELDLEELRREFHIWKATDWEADPVLFAATAMQVFVEHEEQLKEQSKRKQR